MEFVHLASKMTRSSIDQVNSLLEDYAKRGVFRGFSRQSSRDGVLSFKVVWFYNRVFDLIVDTRKKTISIPVALPRLPDNIYADFKAFVHSHHNEDLPEHRRTEKAKARLRCANRGGNVSVGLTVRDGDYEYALQRLIHLVHETFVIFLSDGRYRDYVVEQLGANPEW